MEPFVERIYESWGTEATLADRIVLLPPLTTIELEQLAQLVCPTWDGNVISKSARGDLVGKGLAARWNGLSFITQAGMCVLDTLGMLGDTSQFRGGLKRAKAKKAE
jgi:hypothetical protein